ncbi:MAG: toll/interleukin-1 receptor domain-containing protein [Cyclobacteriaceae bacterium]|nr:toll/interleukin-1 receptor domain-containing protein [Cyclobacteriaceae bacterium]
MPNISGSWISDKFSWQFSEDSSNELNIEFIFFGKLTKRSSFLKLEKRIIEGVLPWLKREYKKWVFDLDLIRKTFPQLKGVKLLSGKVLIDPEVEESSTYGSLSTSTLVSFVITKNEIAMQQSKKIFLSHKSVDKKMVRRFKRALEAIGYEVWFDEQNLKAGDHLERGILKGFDESCAAVFFVTENFQDEKYLKSEVNYAIAETRKKDYFKVIALAFKSGRKKVEMPALFEQFVWKDVATEMDGLIEIINALPIVPTQFDFKS